MKKLDNPIDSSGCIFLKASLATQTLRPISETLPSYFQIRRILNNSIWLHNPGFTLQSYFNNL